MQETSPKSPPYSFNVGDYNLIDDEEMGYDVSDTWSRHNQSKSNVGKVSNIDRHGADNPGSAPSYTSKYGNSSLYTPNLFKKPLRETAVTNRDMAPNGARPTKVRTNQDIGLIGRKAIKPKSNVDIATNGSRTQKSRNTGDLALLPRVQKVTPNRTLHNSGANGAAGRTHAVSRSDLYSKGELPDTNNAGKASKEDVNFVLRGDHSNYGKQTTATSKILCVFYLYEYWHQHLKIGFTRNKCQVVAAVLFGKICAWDTLLCTQCLFISSYINIR